MYEPTPIPGELFTISPHPEDGTVVLVAEHSDLRDYDVGLTIAVRSNRTGQVVRFTEAGEDYDRHGDVAGWRFVPVPVDRDTIPGAHRTRLLIIND